MKQLNNLMSALDHTDLVSVKFYTKKNKIRVMDCTRNLQSIPVEKQDGINTAKLQHHEVICVYDLLVGDWRSFRIDSVISYNDIMVTH